MPLDYASMFGAAIVYMQADAQTTIIHQTAQGILHGCGVLVRIIGQRHSAHMNQHLHHNVL